VSCLAKIERFLTARFHGRYFSAVNAAFFVIVAVLARVIYRWRVPPIISRDSVTYIGQIQAWLASGSFAAFFNMQPDFRTPPLFLYLTLLISRCGVSVEAAAFILQNLCTVTLLLFSLAVVRLFFRNNLYAFMTAAVVAFHPTLFDLSFVLGRELLYLALLAAFTYCILVYLRNGGLAASTLAGGATALCMLTRYEGVELTILALSFFPTVWLTRLRPGRSALAAALLFYAGLIAAFLVCGVLIGFLPVLPELAMNSIQSIFTEHYVHAVFN